MEITKTDRGFELVVFDDANEEKCTLQQSSATMGGRAGTDFIWLGVHEPRIQIMKSDAVALGINVEGEVSGWMDYPLPHGVESFSRMHLCRDHVMQLIPLLQRWVVTGSFSLD